MGRRAQKSGRQSVDEDVAFVVAGAVVESAAAAEQEKSTRLGTPGKTVGMGLIKKLLDSRSQLVLVHLEGRCGHRILHPATVGQQKGDDLPDPVVSKIREHA